MIEINTIRDEIDFTSVQRVLIVKLQHLGDVLLTTPLFSVLKQQFPHVEIDVLVYQETAAVLQNNPSLSKVHVIDRKWKKIGLLFQLRREIELFNHLKARKYSLIINLTDRWRGAWLTRLLKPNYSVSQAYQHRRGKFWRKSFSHIYRVPKQYRHTVEKNLDAVRRLGVRVAQNQKKLVFMPDKISEDMVQELFNTNRLGQKKVIVIHPTSRWMFKAWSQEGFANLIDILKSSGFDVILISGPAEIEVKYAEDIVQKVQGDVLNLAGRLSLSECAALIRQADCMIGLDSVAMHIAAAVATPCVALFGPTIDKVWQPWMVLHRVIAEDYACRPCGLKGCGDGMVSECLQTIRPEAVFQAVQSLVGNCIPKQGDAAC